MKENKNISKCYGAIKEISNRCQECHLGIISASSSFYLILTFIPFCLVITRVLGFFLGENTNRFQLMMIYISEFIPPHLDSVFAIVEEILKRAMFSDAGFNLINFVFLILSSLGFINSIWQALNIITGDKKASQFKNTIKGIGVLGITLGFLLLSIIIPILFKLIGNVAQLSYVKMIITYMNIEKIVSLLNYATIGANILSFIFIIAFMMFILKFILSKHVNFRSAFIGAFTFTTLMVLIKSFFFLYVGIVQKGLVANYGASYGLILLFFWIMFSMMTFYFSVILALSLHKRLFSRQLNA